MTNQGQNSAEIIDVILSNTRDIPDFPKPGVLFKDLTPVFSNPEAFALVLDDMTTRWRGKVDALIGVEARGFILAAPLSVSLGVPFILVRKAGKLPGAVISQDYELEYGSATIEMAVDSFSGGEKVLVLDDLLATGGTAAAACKLVERSGAKVAGIDMLMELTFLPGREVLADYELHTYVKI